MKKFTLWAALFCVIGNKASAQVYEFSSQDYDIEKPEGNLIKTNYEVTYHIFDFTQKTVSFEAANSKSERTIIKYDMQSFYKESGILAETWVIVVNQKGVKEIWFSIEANNLGYDLSDGTRFAFYEIKRIK